MSSRKISINALSNGVPFAVKESTLCLKFVSASATAVLRTISADAQFASEPTARNSNLLPVNANGEVLFLSVLSMKSSGISVISSSTPCLSFIVKISFKSAFSMCSKMLDNCFPKNEDMIAGGASFAPKR